MSEKVLNTSDEVAQSPGIRGPRHHIAWIDSARGLASFLVVFGHAVVLERVEVFIFAFHVPLFFAISGWLDSDCDHSSPWRRFKKRSRMIFRAYLLFAVMSYLFWVLVVRPFGSPVHQAIPLWKPLVGIIYGVGTSEWMPENVPLWFLPCFLCVELIASFLFAFRLSAKALVAIAAGTIFLVSILPENLGLRLPWSLDSAVMALPFFLFSCVSYQSLTKLLKSWSKKTKICGSVFLYALIAWSTGFLETFDIASFYAGKYPALTYIQGFAGIFASALFCSAFFDREKTTLAIIGKHSLIILGLHNLVDTCLRGVFAHALRFDLSLLDHSLLLPFVFAVANVSIIILCFGRLTDILTRK